MAEGEKKKEHPGAKNVEPYKLVAGTERARQMASMGGKASAKKKKEKADLAYVAELLGKYLLKPVYSEKHRGKVVDVDSVDSLDAFDDDKLNQRLIDKTIIEFSRRLASGDKRAITQMIEILGVAAEAENKEKSNGFIEALMGSTKEDWNDEL